MSKVVVLPTKQHNQVRPVHEAVSDLNNIAVTRGRLRHLHTAIVEAKRAVAVLPHSKEVWNNLATFFWNARQYDEALACVERCLAIDGQYQKAYFNKALIKESMGDVVEAERLFGIALELSPEERDNITRCLGMMLLARGDYSRGFKAYESRIPYSRTLDGAKNIYPYFPAPYWQGESIRGKRIFCCVEQGIGDTIMFSRWLPWLKRKVGPKGKVYLCCAHEVMVLLWEFYLAGIVEFVPEGVPIPEADYSVVMGSLPFHAKTTMSTLPFDPGLIRKRADVQMRIGPAKVPAPLGPDGYKVGIVWTGNPAQERNDERSIPLELMLTFAEHPNVWLYSLQAHNGKGDIKRLGAEDIVCDLGPQLEERGLTVAATAILQMDLVITCCTSVAHLAGALGVEAWVVLCENPYWVWMTDQRTHSAWYPSLRLFRQSTTDDWKGVIRRVRDALVDRVDELKSRKQEIANG